MVFNEQARRTLPLSAIVVASLLLYIFLSTINGFKIGVFDDSGSYFLAADEYMRGEIDFLRTPLYPLICRFAVWLSAPNVFTIIVVMQEAVFLCSIVAIFNTIATLGIGRKITLFVTAAYALCPLLFLSSNQILTESLAISFSAFFACAIANTLFGKHQMATAATMPPLLFLMIMLRPFFVCFIPVAAIVLLYSLYVNRSNIRHTIAIATSSAIVAVALLGYCTWYYNTFGKFGFSCVYELNRCVFLNDFNYGKPSEGITYYNYTSPPDINGDSITMLISWRWKPSDSYRAECKKIYEQKKIRYIKDKVIELHRALYHEFFYAKKQIPLLYYCGRLFVITLAQICMFVLLFIAVEAFYLKRRSPLTIMSGSMAAICIATVFTSIWGAYADYGRLVMPMMPCLFVMAAIFLSRFTISPLKQKPE